MKIFISLLVVISAFGSSNALNAQACKDVLYNLNAGSCVSYAWQIYDSQGNNVGVNSDGSTSTSTALIESATNIPYPDKAIYWTTSSSIIQLNTNSYYSNANVYFHKVGTYRIVCQRWNTGFLGRRVKIDDATFNITVSENTPETVQIKYLGLSNCSNKFTINNPHTGVKYYWFNEYYQQLNGGTPTVTVDCDTRTVYCFAPASNLVCGNPVDQSVSFYTPTLPLKNQIYVQPSGFSDSNYYLNLNDGDYLYLNTSSCRPINNGASGWNYNCNNGGYLAYVPSGSTSTSSVAGFDFPNTGTYLITVSANDANDPSFSMNQTVQVIVYNNFKGNDSEVSFLKTSEQGNKKQNPNFKAILVYPNPVSDLINIERVSDFKEVSLTSLDGKVLENHKIDNSINQITIPTSSYNTGLYLLRLIDNSGNIKTEKLTIQH